MTNLALVHNFEPFVCPQCKFEITTPTMHGWLNGGFRGNKTQLVVCPLCTNSAQARQKAEQVSQLLGGAHLPIYAQGWSFATTPQDIDQRVVARCERFMDEAGSSETRGLFLYGAPGVGKTGLAISCVQAAIGQGMSAAFIRSLDLMNRLRIAIAQGTHDGDDLLHLVESVDFLALDDLATERPTPYVIEQLYAVIETRRSMGLLTVVTSNYTLTQLEQHWRPLDPVTHQLLPDGTFHAGRRVTERLAEYCLGLLVRGRNKRNFQSDEKIRPIR